MRILIVDDEQSIGHFFSRLAMSRGHTNVDTASSGEEAMTRVIRQSYDLITLDIQMPGASGLEIISMLRNMCPHAVIAIISGYIPDEISREVAGCADVMIPKPINMESFSQLLEGTEQISQVLKQIRSLGTTSTVPR